jgi:hypothetical protein
MNEPESDYDESGYIASVNPNTEDDWKSDLSEVCRYCGGRGKIICRCAGEHLHLHSWR